MADKERLVITPEGLTVMQDGQSLLVDLEFPNDKLGLAPHLQLAMRMSLSEARQYGQSLLDIADAVEASREQ